MKIINAAIIIAMAKLIGMVPSDTTVTTEDAAILTLWNAEPPQMVRGEICLRYRTVNFLTAYQTQSQLDLRLYAGEQHHTIHGIVHIERDRKEVWELTLDHQTSKVTVKWIHEPWKLNHEERKILLTSIGTFNTYLGYLPGLEELIAANTDKASIRFMELLAEVRAE